MEKNRLEISRLFHRFGFGPKPGEFATAVKKGLKQTQERVLNISDPDYGAANLARPQFSDLGARPKPNSPGVIDFVTALKNQSNDLTLWWLDKMVVSDFPLIEKMTWFWHGHWATSIKKVEYPLTMFKQNENLRAHAVGNFQEMSQAMVNDGALQLWLDGQTNSVASPNENLARELMELFTIGVNKYSEEDVKAAAKALTGYQVTPSNGQVSLNPKRRNLNPITILGVNKYFTGEGLSDFLVERPDCQSFIAERIWFRFISSTEGTPKSFEAYSAFAKRQIYPTISAAARSKAISNPKYEMVKSPVEWFVGSCRALEIIPSQLQTSDRLFTYLDRLGQLPFAPPSVGGWPAGSAWLSSASSLYRIEFAKWLIKRSQLNFLKATPSKDRVVASENWLGVYSWSERTKVTLNSAASDPELFALLALCAPEYLVNA